LLFNSSARAVETCVGASPGLVAMVNLLF
jgi:hypothetical protein